MTFEEAGKQQEENKKRDMTTKYRDEDIRSIIDDGVTDAYQNFMGNTGTSKLLAAQTMIAYNEMIDRRWENA